MAEEEMAEKGMENQEEGKTGQKPEKTREETKQKTAKKKGKKSKKKPKKEETKKGEKQKALKDTEKGKKKQKEEKSKEQKKPGKGIPNIPIHIFALAIIAALVIGYAASIFLAPTPIININDDLNRIKPPEKQVKVILLYDDNCSVCEQSHSFLGILQRSGIEVYLAKVPLSDKEGKKIILDFNISQLPTLLVVKSTVAPEMKVKMLGAEKTLQETLEAIGTEKYDYYIVEEGNFDGVAHTTTLLSGMTFSYCEDPKNIAVDLFEDPYSPNTIKFKTTTWDVREMFDKNVNFQYGFMPTVTDKYPPIIQEKAQYLAEAMLCSIQAGKFNEFERAFYTKYCDKNGNNRLDAGEMEQCTTGGAALPLEESEVNKVAQDANIPVDLINVCRKELVGIFLESSKNKANMFLVTTTPTAVVQCKYKTHPKYLKDVICFVKPELEACKQSATGTNPKNSPDTNTGK